MENSVRKHLLDSVLSNNLQLAKHFIRVRSNGANMIFRCTLEGNSSNEFYTASLLTLAVVCGHRRMVKLLLDTGNSRKRANPNLPCDLSPLGVAVEKNDCILVAALLNAGADVTLPSFPLKFEPTLSADLHKMMPSQLADGKRHAAILFMLKQHVRQPLSVDLVDFEKDRASPSVIITQSTVQATFDDATVTTCAFSNYIQVLLSSEVMQTTGSRAKEPAIMSLHCACAIGELNRAKMLISKGYDVNERDENQNTPIHYACLTDKPQLVELLIDKGADFEAENSEGESPLHFALKFNNLSTAFVFISICCSISSSCLKATNSRGNTLLHIACKQNRVMAVFSLLTQGASLTAVNKRGKMPLTYAWSNSGTTKLREIIFYFLWWSSDMYSKACLMQVMESCLINHSVSATIVKKKPLSLCARCKKIRPQIAYEMLKKDLIPFEKLNVMSCSGACEVSEFMVIPQISNDDLRLVLHLQVKLRSRLGSDRMKLILSPGDDGFCRPLHAACRYGFEKAVKSLLVEGADVNCVDGVGKTPLWYAFKNDHESLVYWLISQKDIGVVVDNGVLWGLSCKGCSLLLMLSGAGTDAITLLAFVEKGARINNLTVQNTAHPRSIKTLLSAAIEFQGYQLAQTLLQHGCCDRDDHIPRVYSFSSFLTNHSKISDVVKWQKCLLLAGLKLSRNELQFTQNTDVSEIDRNWLTEELENPPSLARLCTYTIRRHLTMIDPHGRSIYLSTRKLPLPPQLRKLVELQSFSDVVTFDDSLKFWSDESFFDSFYDCPIHFNSEHFLTAKWFWTAELDAYPWLLFDDFPIHARLLFGPTEVNKGRSIGFRYRYIHALNANDHETELVNNKKKPFESLPYWYYLRDRFSRSQLKPHASSLSLRRKQLKQPENSN